MKGDVRYEVWLEMSHNVLMNSLKMAQTIFLLFCSISYSISQCVCQRDTVLSCLRVLFTLSINLHYHFLLLSLTYTLTLAGPHVSFTSPFQQTNRACITIHNDLSFADK